MPRINLDLDFLDHPKTLNVSPLAQLLFIRSLIYAARHLTDGKLPKSAYCLLTHDFFCPIEQNAPSLSLELVNELVKVGWWEEKNGQYEIHDYLDYQLSRHQVSQLSKKRKEIGQRGGLAKAKQLSSKSLANSYPLTNPNPNPNLEEKTLAPWQERLVVFWNAYPKKRGKGHVEKWFKQHQPSIDLLNAIIAKVSILSRSPEWLKDSGQFIPYPSTFLNAKGWEDEIATHGGVPCQARVNDGRFLRPCGRPSTAGTHTSARCDQHGGTHDH